jgi:hypothetical protein
VGECLRTRCLAEQGQSVSERGNWVIPRAQNSELTFGKSGYVLNPALIRFFNSGSASGPVSWVAAIPMISKAERFFWCKAQRTGGGGIGL